MAVGASGAAATLPGTAAVMGAGWVPGSTLRPSHTPTATLATMAAAASQRSRARLWYGGISFAPVSWGAAAWISLRRASICGHRSRLGSMACGRSLSDITLRPPLSPAVMSVDLHVESLAQELARAVQLRLAGALGDAEHLRRLAVRVAVQRMQHQRVAGPVGQRADRALDFLHFHRRLHGPLRRHSFVVFRHRLDLRALASLRQAHVHRDAVQPGRK